MTPKNPLVTQLIANIRYAESVISVAEEYANKRADHEQNVIAQQYDLEDKAYWYWQGYAAGRRKGAEFVGETVRGVIHTFCPPLPMQPLHVVVDNTKPEMKGK